MAKAVEESQGLDISNMLSASRALEEFALDFAGYHMSNETNVMTISTNNLGKHLRCFLPQLYISSPRNPDTPQLNQDGAFTFLSK